MSHNKVMAGFITPITGGFTQGLAIGTLLLLKIRILFLGSHIRETKPHGIPIHPHNKTSNHNHNHNHQLLNFNQDLVTNLHQMYMCLHIRRHKKTTTKSCCNR